MQTTLRIAIIGPEATGKTTLTESLNRHFQRLEFASVKTEEYARKYFEDKGLKPNHQLSVQQMREVMKGQRAFENAAAESIKKERGIIWIDASTVHGPLYAGMKYRPDNSIYFDLYEVDQEVMDYGRKGGYDAFLLCMPHESLAWEDDGLRAMPNLADRQRFAEGCISFVERFYPHAVLETIDAATWEAREEQAIAIAEEWIFHG